MGQIRINELCRELEVKSKRVLKYLVEIGVTDKKSHSDSIEDSLANRVRAHFVSLRATEQLRLRGLALTVKNGDVTLTSTVRESGQAKVGPVVTGTKIATTTGGATASVDLKARPSKSKAGVRVPMGNVLTPSARRVTPHPLKLSAQPYPKAEPSRIAGWRSRRMKSLKKLLQRYETGKVSGPNLVAGLKGMFGITNKKQIKLRALWKTYQSGEISKKQWVIQAQKLLWRSKRRKKGKKRRPKVAKIRLRSPFGSQATRWSRVRLFQGGRGG
jgi:hypothetical protein